MIRPMTATNDPAVTVWVHTGSRLAERLPCLTAFAMDGESAPLSRDPRWLAVLHRGLGQEIFAVEARAHGRTCGYLPLAFVDTVLFGKFLVSLPYLNSNGVIAAAADVQSLLIDRAVALAQELGVNHLELRHETPIQHASLTGEMASKVQMRRELPATTELLWKGFDSKLRNQLRKGEKNGFVIDWGGADQIDPFYAVLSENMRDLGTPFYGRELFRAILRTFPGEAEIAVVRDGPKAIAAALLLHGNKYTEVPTASSLKDYNHRCANMWMYHQLLARAVERGQRTFDFGRSTFGGPTFQFKKQWGTVATPATWQYASFSGQIGAMRPDNPRYERMIKLWRRLPVRLTQYLGPPIVRGIP